MTRRMIFPVLLGVLGAAILAGLGTWQLQRLSWKEAILSDIQSRMTAAPVAIPAEPDYAADNYRRVQVRGTLVGEELHVLTTRKPEGPSFRVIQALDTSAQGRILVDLGTIPERAKTETRHVSEVLIEGNLIWPDETDGFTPDPDQDQNMWFARNVDLMAAALEARPLMVAATATDPQLEPRPWPVGVNIPNDHLQYAITWFSLMVIWVGMTLYLIVRIRRNGRV